MKLIPYKNFYKIRISNNNSCNFFMISLQDEFDEVSERLQKLLSAYNNVVSFLEGFFLLHSVLNTCIKYL